MISLNGARSGPAISTMPPRGDGSGPGGLRQPGATLFTRGGRVGGANTTWGPARGLLGAPRGGGVAAGCGGGGEARGPPRAQKGHAFGADRPGAADNDDLH